MCKKCCSIEYNVVNFNGFLSRNFWLPYSLPIPRIASLVDLITLAHAHAPLSACAGHLVARTYTIAGGRSHRALATGAHSVPDAADDAADGGACGTHRTCSCTCMYTSTHYSYMYSQALLLSAQTRLRFGLCQCQHAVTTGLSAMCMR